MGIAFNVPYMYTLIRLVKYIESVMHELVWISQPWNQKLYMQTRAPESIEILALDLDNIYSFQNIFAGSNLKELHTPSSTN